MDTDKIRRPKSEARKKSEARSPKALCHRLGKSHARSQIAMDKDLGGKAIPSEVVSVTDGHDHGDFGGWRRRAFRAMRGRRVRRCCSCGTRFCRRLVRGRGQERGREARGEWDLREKWPPVRRALGWQACWHEASVGYPRAPVLPFGLSQTLPNPVSGPAGPAGGSARFHRGGIAH